MRLMKRLNLTVWSYERYDKREKECLEKRMSRV